MAAVFYSLWAPSTYRIYEDLELMRLLHARARVKELSNTAHIPLLNYVVLSAARFSALFEVRSWFCPFLG